MKTQLFTRNVCLGALLALVLVFSVQGTADALSFTSQITRTDRPNVSFVYPDQTFDLRFTVRLESDTLHPVETGTTRGTKSAFEKENVRAGLGPPVVQGFTNNNTTPTGLTAETATDYYYYDRTDTVNPPTTTRTWVTKPAAYYYNEEAVTITPGANISIVSINGYTVNSGAGVVYELNEDKDWGGTTTSELLRTTINVRFQAGATSGQGTANQIFVSDTTPLSPLTDYPSGVSPATAPTSSPFQITVVRRIPGNAVDIPTLASVSASQVIRAHETRTPITATLDGSNNTWYEVDFAIASGSSGTLSEKQDGTGNTGRSLTAYTNDSNTTTVYLNPSRSTTKVQVTVAGRSPGSTTPTHSRTVTLFYQSANLEADLTIDGPGGNGQSGVVDTRLTNPFVVKVTDGTNRGVSGQAVTFTPGSTGGVLFPHSDFGAEPTSVGSATAGYTVLVVKTDRSGEAKVYFELSSTIDEAHTVDATFFGITRQFTATALSTTTTRVLRVDTENSVQEQSVARLTTASKPLVVRVLAGGVSEFSGQPVRFTTADGVLTPRREASQLTDTVSTPPIPNLPTDRTIETNASGEAWIDYTAGNTEGPVTIYARAYNHSSSGGSFTRIDSANTVIFRVNVGGTTYRPPPGEDEDEDEDEDDDTTSVTLRVPSSISGPPGSTRTLSIVSSARPSLAEDIDFVGDGGDAPTPQFVSGNTYSSRLTLPDTAGTYDLTVRAGNQSRSVSVRVTEPEVQTGGTVRVSVSPGSGAPGSPATVTVTARDSDEALASGVSVTLSITSGGGTLVPGTVETGTDGTATSKLTRGSTAGNNYYITASVPTGYTFMSQLSAGERVTITGTDTRTPPPAPAGEPAEVFAFDGEDQTGALNTPLSEPLVVEVVDGNDNPVERVRVRFRTTIGSGRFSPRSNVRTDEDGLAEITFTPTSPGRIRISARVPDVSGTAVFNVTAGAAPDSLTQVSGDTQSGTPGNALGDPFVVEVKDADGEPIEGISVTFSVTAGGGSLSARNVPADEDGRAETTLTLGSERGVNSVEASVSGVDPVTFSTSVEPNVLVAAANRPVMYWIDNGMLYSLAGAQEAKIAESANGVAVGGGKIYWTEQTGASRGTINSANLDGTDVGELVSIRSVPMGIAVDTAGRKLYWTASSGKVKRANLNGSGSETVVQDLSDPTDIVVSNGFIYWTEGGNSIRRVNISGQKIVRDVAVNLDTVGGLAVGGGKVYWTEQTSASTGTVNGANLNGTNFETLASTLSVPMGIAVDTAGSKVYWTSSSGKVKRANLDGSRGEKVVEGLISPSALAIGGANTETTATTTKKATTPAKKDNAAYDVNDDGAVDNTDASLVAAAMGTSTAKYDVNGDGTVNFLDLLLVFDNRDDAAAAPTIVGMKLSTVQIERIEEQIDLLIATNDRSPAALRTLVYLQQLLATARPEKTQLFANYPNPFNPETWIPYELATDTNVKIRIYNTQGVVIRMLQFGHQSAGYYTDQDRAAYWDGRNALGEQVASGLYFYQLETDEMSSMRKMVILK